MPTDTEITLDTSVDEIIKNETIEQVIKLEDELKKVKKKSDKRKRHLRDLNKKIEMYIALADAAISDAARFKLESVMWKNKYESLMEEKNNE